MQRVQWLMPRLRRGRLALLLLLIISGLLLPGAALAAPLQSPPADRQPCAAIHTVQRGQNLTVIARYYGVGLYELAQANNIHNINRIYVGQRLCIPGVYSPPPPGPQPGDRIYYTVKPGDTLAKIAWQFGVSVPYLMQINRLNNPNRIEVGQVLLVSDGPMPMPPPMPQPPPPPQPPPQPVDVWVGSYYNNKDLQGAPLFVRSDPNINFNWGTGNPGGGLGDDNFSVRWTRSAYSPGGRFRLFVTVDDGVRLFVDDQIVIDAWRVQPSTNLFGDVTLSPGYHTVRLEYFEESGVAGVTLNWTQLQ